MAATIYEREWQRQLARTGIPEAHLPVHRWYLRIDDPDSAKSATDLPDGLTLVRARNCTVDFYRFLYHTAGEDYLWGDRRRMSDADLARKISAENVHVMVFYFEGTPAGYFEIAFGTEATNINYFALLPGFIGKGLGKAMLDESIRYAAAQQPVPLTLDTCTLDHPVALENYRARGFEIYDEEDEIYPDPRVDGTVPKDSGKHVPIRV